MVQFENVIPVSVRAMRVPIEQVEHPTDMHDKPGTSQTKSLDEITLFNC